MSGHTGAVFNNSCLKVPVNPQNKLPFPSYEQKLANHLRNQHIRASSDSEASRPKMKTQKATRNDALKSFIDFYDSIPDYSDVNHLSNKEFYKKIENLKEKQKSYYDFLETEFRVENKTENFVDEYKRQASGSKSSSRKSERTYKRDSPETESVSSYGKEIPVNPPSRRSVRIESPKFDSESRSTSENDFNSDAQEIKNSKSARNISSAGSKDSKFLWDFDRDSPLTARSVPNSPVKNKPSVGWKDCGITIPKPFRMTIRDEEDKIVSDILLKTRKPKQDKPELFRAHPVPIESKIPLYDKIIEEQEIRSQIVKIKSKEALKAKMKPFSFTRREEELNSLTRRFSKSSPQLSIEEPPLKIKHFRAKPVPKNLFSNYIYKKMHEDEFYRALKKKIRAEEMLKRSSLPPNMARREKTQSKPHICPRNIRNFDIDDDMINKTSKNLNHVEELELELDDLQNEFISTTPRPFKFQTAKRQEKRSKSAKRCHRASEYESTESKRAQSALGLQSVNKSNLAAVLRIQSASISNISSIPTPRKRMEMEMVRKLEEQKLKEESRWREKVMRQKPVWQELNYSHEEDLAMRLQMRREEEKLREEEHKHHMELMFGRVQQMPTLFERQSQLQTPLTQKEILNKFYHEIDLPNSPKITISEVTDSPTENYKQDSMQIHIDDAKKNGEDN